MMKCEVCGNKFGSIEVARAEPDEGYTSCPYCGTEYLLADKYPPPLVKVFGNKDKILVRL